MGALDGKTAVVTGGTRGIGRAIVERFLQEGAKVALCAADQHHVSDATAELAERFGERVLGVACDVAQAAQVRRWAEAVQAHFGSVQLVVNNAGVVVREPLATLSEADWDHVVDVNLKGTFLVSQAFLPSLRAAVSQGSEARIINIASISGTLGTPRLTAYCAAKHGVIGLTRALAEELRDEKIQVNAVNPGSVDTEMLQGSGFPPRMAPAAIAGVVLYLAAQAPSALTGACVDVFG